MRNQLQAQHEMECRLFLDVVVAESSAVLELFASEDQALLVWRNALFILDFLLDVVDRVGWLDLERDGLTGESFDEDLHVLTTSADFISQKNVLTRQRAGLHSKYARFDSDSSLDRRVVGHAEHLRA